VRDNPPRLKCNARPARQALVLCRDLRAKAKPARKVKSKRKQNSRANSAQTSGERAKEESLFQHGVTLFNHRKFFEAHEAWEEIWLHAKVPEKTFLQGLIQVTAAFHHHSRGNLHGMESLLRRGLAKLDEFPASHRGLRIGALRASARAWLAAIDENKRENHMAESPRLPVLWGKDRLGIFELARKNKTWKLQLEGESATEALMELPKNVRKPPDTPKRCEKRRGVAVIARNAFRANLGRDASHSIALVNMR
jgi:hypothetical protein